MFFLESALLVLLLRKPGYGYSLIDGLAEFGFQTERLDASVIYRALRDLESAGLVNENWDNNQIRTPRRVSPIPGTSKADNA